MGLKTASIVTHDGMSGPRDHTVLTSPRAKPALFSRLFTFDCKGEHLLTCAPASGIIYKVCSSKQYACVKISYVVHKCTVGCN